MADKIFNNIHDLTVNTQHKWLELYVFPLTVVKTNTSQPSYLKSVHSLYLHHKWNKKPSYCSASQQYCIVSNSRAACWRSDDGRLFQTRKFWRFACSPYVLMYSPDGIKRWEIWGDRVSVGVESCKIMFLGALPIHLFRHSCCRMYRLVMYRLVRMQCWVVINYM